MDWKTRVRHWVIARVVIACSKSAVGRITWWCSSNRPGHLCGRRRWPVWDRCPTAGPSGIHEGLGHGTLRDATCPLLLSAVYYIKDRTETPYGATDLWTDNVLDQVFSAFFNDKVFISLREKDPSQGFLLNVTKPARRPCHCYLSPSILQ